MKKLLTVLFSLITINGFCQSLDSIKHIEIISEIQDSMALINKTDIDKINKTFYELKLADSLNVINDSIINSLYVKNHVLDSILQTQKVMIENEKSINDHLVIEHSSEINYYKKELKKSNNRKIAWQSTTGVSLLAIILILIL